MNEVFTIPKAIDAVKTRTISVLTTDVGTRRLIGVSRGTMEEVLKSCIMGYFAGYKEAKLTGNKVSPSTNGVYGDSKYKSEIGGEVFFPIRPGRGYLGNH